MKKQIVDDATPRTAASRRDFLKAGAGTAALLAAVKTSFLGGVHIAEASGPEVTTSASSR